MQNIARVRHLLQASLDLERIDMRERNALEGILDLMQKGKPKDTIDVVVTGLVLHAGSTGEIALHMISSQMVPRIIKAFVLAFPNERSYLIQTLAFLVGRLAKGSASSRPDNHCGVILGLFEAAALGLGTKEESEEVDKDFLCLLDKVVESRCFKDSPHQLQLAPRLSSAIAEYVKMAAQMSKQKKVYRWRGLQEILSTGYNVHLMDSREVEIPGVEIGEPVETIEAALLRELRFKCFSQLTPDAQFTAVLSASVPA